VFGPCSTHFSVCDWAHPLSVEGNDESLGAVAVECDEEVSRFAANCEALHVGDFMSPAEGGADVEGVQEAVRVEVVVARLVRSWTGARWVQMEWCTEN
jgi:hypothetical protein